MKTMQIVPKVKICVPLTYVNEPDSLVILEKFQRQRDIVQLLGSESRISVEARKLASCQHFSQLNQFDTVTKVGLLNASAFDMRWGYL